MTWRTVHEHIVADVFHSKKSSSALLVHEEQASQKYTHTHTHTHIYIGTSENSR